jgi:hypothetical protein
MKQIISSFLTTIFAAVLLVAALSMSATPAKAQVAASCQQYAEATYFCSCPSGYVPATPANPDGSYSSTIGCNSNFNYGNGDGGGGFPQSCGADAMTWYYLGEQMWGYVDPDWFYSQFGCYPY